MSTRSWIAVVMVVVGIGLAAISYFVLAAPWVTTGAPSGEAVLPGAAALFIAGVVLVFLAAVVYELQPGRPE